MHPCAKWIALLAALVGTLSAAPKLRLGSTVALTASVTRGQDGRDLSIEATNAGDGQLALSVTTTMDWLEAVVDPQVCASPSPCKFPIRIRLRTAKLPVGTVTGFVIASDPDAEDAPQSVSVTVTIASTYPNEVQFYVKPDGKAQEWMRSGPLQFGRSVGPDLQIVQQPFGGPTLSLVVSSQGTFVFNYVYRLSAAAPPGTAVGDYPAALLSNSAGRIPVGIRVSNRNPITPSETALQFRTATGFAPQRRVITLGLESNPFRVFDVKSEARWLTATSSGEREIEVTASPEGLEPGTFKGDVVIYSDAANDVLRIPVTLEVSPPGPALIARARPSLGSQFANLARGMLVSIQGDQLFSGFGDVQLFFNDRPIRTLSTPEYGRIDFQIPFDAVAGQNLVRLDRDGFPGVSFGVGVAPLNPRLLWAQTPDGTVVSSQYSPRVFVNAGDAIHLFGDGFGAPVIAVAAGEPAPEGAIFEEVPEIIFYSSKQGGALYRPKPTWAGLAPGTIGLSKITVVIPEELRGAGEVLVRTTRGTSSFYLNVH